MTDSDLKLLYRWSREELNNGNRIKASRIRKVYDYTFDVELLLGRFSIKD